MNFKNTFFLFYRKKLSTMICVALSIPPVISFVARADDLWFNPSSLQNISGSTTPLTLEGLSLSGEQLPGKYHVDIYVNDSFVVTEDIYFFTDGGKLSPDLTIDHLRLFGVNVDAFPGLSNLRSQEPIDKYVPGVSSSFDFGRQRLDLSIPQAALLKKARGYTDPKTWDQGVNAAFSSYNFSQSESKSGPHNEQSSFLSTRNGINLGAWRLRNYSTWSKTRNTSDFSSINTYLQRDIQFLRGQLTAGDNATSADIFDSFQFRGLQLASDDNMLPDSLRGFAPIVRGIASTNAQVTIQQNGTTIYQTYVAPGAFSIEDLYPTTSSGNLDVIIKEASGEEHRFTQAFSAAPLMLRENGIKYSVTAGQYRSTSSNVLNTKFGSFSVIYGLPHNFTVYGGAIGAGNYLSAATGLGYSLGELGAMSADVTHARTRFQNGNSSDGQSYRLQYAKSINKTGTSVTLAGYRYTTKGYFDFGDANDGSFNNNRSHSGLNRRSKTQLTVSQNIGTLGSLYVSGYQQNYWNQTGYERSASVGYNKSFNRISYSLNYSFSQSPGVRKNQAVVFGMSIPLSKWLNNSWATYSLNSSRNSNSSQQVGINGTALRENNLAYNVQHSHGSGNSSDSGYASLDYKGTYGRSNVGYNYGKKYHQANFGLQGGVIFHADGVTLSQPLSDTFALVKAPGAAGVSVSNNTGVKTDWRGYTAIPYLSTYRATRISLEPSTLSDDMEIENVSQTVVPTQGAIVLAAFEPKSGKRAIITLLTATGEVPFGAQARLLNLPPDEYNTGFVGSNGQIYMAGLPDSGSIAVKWGEQPDAQCKADFVIPKVKKSKVFALTTQCR